MNYYRPIVVTDAIRPSNAKSLAGGATWFVQCEKISRSQGSEIVNADDIPSDVLDALTADRKDIAGLSMDCPRIMGVLNTTPDSFSDGGKYNERTDALAHGHAMIKAGADIVDVGGESTRPGADLVNNREELLRTTAVVKELSKHTVVSIDTRKADVAEANLKGGAQIFNDVTALSFDEKSIDVVGNRKPFVCLMHASGDPKTMQNSPSYQDVVLDIYDYLADRVALCLKAGLPKERIIVDPGIGFGKTTEHNLLLIQSLSIFHGLGCPILLGVSRKRFIGEITKTQQPADRMAGSLALAQEGLRQGVQILRVHDVGETAQMVRMWNKLY